MELPFVSIVVPVFHDTEALARLIVTLQSDSEFEIIVVNGDAGDSSLEKLIDDRPDIRCISSPSGRGRQMNVGAQAARGRWFLFLHADTRLSPLWLHELRRIDADASVIGGSFRFQLDSDTYQARLIERGVAWRVRWFGLAYGDQALFVRRESFHALGGYREWSLMEDVDFIRRLRRIGRLNHSPLPAITSARRWEHDGWWQRSTRNVVLQALFFAGVSPDWLFERYGRAATGSTSQALVVMARSPSDPRGKTRLTRDVAGDHVALRRAILLDTHDAAAGVPGADVIVAFEPAEARAEFQSLIGISANLMPQRGQTLGDRMHNVFVDLFSRGYKSVVMIGSDLPTLPPRYIEDAFGRLRAREESVVIGPATDGGYYLIGLRRLVPGLFDAVPWSTPNVLRLTREAAARARLVVATIPQWYDVDGIDDLRRAVNEPTGGERTRSWARAHPALLSKPHVAESASLR